MFSIAILKLKDVIKFAIVIVVAIFIIIFCAKKLNSLSKILDQTLPAIKNMNEEYRNISKEEDPAIDKNILKSMMKTQISSVKGLEEIEAKQKEKDTKHNSDRLIHSNSGK